MTETGTETQPAESSQGAAFRYVHSTNFADLLERLQICLAVSTYQAGKLMVVRAAGGRVSTLLRSFETPMGLAVGRDRLAVGTRRQVWFLRNAPEIAPQLEPAGRHDACYVPRYCHVTGDFRGHEMGFVEDELWIVNTRFSCLCTLDPDYSFVPRWRPPFVTAYAAEDRCHLNGLALAGGRVRYVTALGTTDRADGWRERKTDGGVILDVDSGEVVAHGLAMPHSPRVHNDRLFVLNSGHGHLSEVDSRTGKVQCIAELPGYTRGLAIHWPFAFVGLSRIRESNTFGGLPIGERLSQRKCGVWCVDLRSGRVTAFLEFESGSEELFDVQVVPWYRWPAVIGFQKQTLSGVFVAPPGTWDR